MSDGVILVLKQGWCKHRPNAKPSWHVHLPSRFRVLNSGVCVGRISLHVSDVLRTRSPIVSHFFSWFARNAPHCCTLTLSCNFKCTLIDI